MSCQDCEDIQNSTNPSVCYYRIENANVAIIGCKKHVKLMLEKLNARP